MGPVQEPAVERSHFGDSRAAASSIAPPAPGPPPTPLARFEPPDDRLATMLLRSVGQRATALLQRQEDGDAEPLTEGQVASAISFYKKQPTQYTAEIMLELQGALGVELTGKADRATVQAVAVWQKTFGANSPALKVDGMAGPRTLPRIFVHGLNVAERAHEFATQSQVGVIDRWHELTPEERAVGLVTLVNTHLQAIGVPPTVPEPTNEIGDDAGRFRFRTWQLRVGLPALSVAQPTLAEAADLVDTIYHEARHAEQWFRMAQLRAMQLHRKPGAAEDDRLVKAIAKEMTIPPTIAEKAVATPAVAGSMQALIAQGWYDSVYGSGAAHRSKTLKALADSDDPAVDAAYRNLPEENDAWATGPMTASGVTRGAPQLPPPGPSPLDALQESLKRVLGVPEPV